MANIFVNIPKIGDAVVGYSDNGKNKIGYIAAETVDLTDMTNKGYLPIGVVYRVRNRQVGVIWKGGAIGNYIWCKKATIKIGGYSLDGAEHEVSYSTYPASSDKEATTGTIKYTATTLAELAASLNTAFNADTALATQNFFAFATDDAVYVTFDLNRPIQNWNYIIFTSGLSQTPTTVPGGTIYGAANHTKLGHAGTFYPVCGLDRAIRHYVIDIPETDWVNFKPSKPLTSMTSGYRGPFTIAQYKGENCQILRDYFETTDEGKASGTQEGYERFLASIQAVRPSGLKLGTDALDGKAITQKLIKVGNEMSALGEVLPAGIVHRYPAAFATQGIYDSANGEIANFLPIEDWYLPTVGDLYDIFDIVKYGFDKSGKGMARNADPINATLHALSGGFIDNRTEVWSCVRFSTYDTLRRFGIGAAFCDSVTNVAYVLPLSLLKLA